MTKPRTSTTASAKRHKHEFTGLWFHFGPHGRQDVHIHSCFNDDCGRVVIGEGRDCKKGAKHWKETL